MVDNNMVLIREYNEEKDIEVVGKLEKNCENIGSLVFTNNMMMGHAYDPLCRIRSYAVHVMLVAELPGNGELVGVVRGCMKCVGTKFSVGKHVKLGCILGLRVSPTHRRMGIGLKLVKSIEEWMVKNGAHYTFLATEESNVASTNLFTTKCNYINFGSLIIYVQPVTTATSSLNKLGQSQDIKIKKLDIYDQAISLYNNKLKTKDIYPTDIDSILQEKLSLGTWVTYFKQDDDYLFDFKSKTPSSWVVFSVWNFCEASYKVHNIRNKSLKFFLSHAKDKIFPCFKKMPICGNPFGFLFLYGVYGEGDRLGELMKYVLSFVSKMAENVKHCKVIMTELGVSDPLSEYVPKESSISRINDLWYLKKVNGVGINGGGGGDEEEEEEVMTMVMGQSGNVFVDPRDF